MSNPSNLWNNSGFSGFIFTLPKKRHGTNQLSKENELFADFGCLKTNEEDVKVNQMAFIESDFILSYFMKIEHVSFGISMDIWRVDPTWASSSFLKSTFHPTTYKQNVLKCKTNYFYNTCSSNSISCDVCKSSYDISVIQKDKKCPNFS